MCLLEESEGRKKVEGKRRRNFQQLLEIAEEYKISGVMRCLEMFLIQCESIHKIRKLEFGAEYRMARLTDLVLRSFKSRIERMESLYDYLAENNEKLLACNTQSSVDGARNMLEELFGNLVYVLLAINAVLFVCIIFSLVWSRWNPVLHRSKKSIHILAIIGSGGHTTEILKLLSGLGEQYSQRTYVLANSDQMGEQKVIEFEQKRPSGKFSIEKIPRSRELDFGLEDTARCCIVKWSWHCSSHLCISLPIWLPSNLHGASHLCGVHLSSQVSITHRANSLQAKAGQLHTRSVA
uniref:UDP-N-acetylglucosamine transferase subunit ALG14 n=1 Tax=Ditylenchus dipsaci TaxID=166011 RepID=A0A915D080_9BILA